MVFNASNVIRCSCHLSTAAVCSQSLSAHTLDCATTHRWCVTSHLTHTCDEPRTMAERATEFMSLPGKIFQSYVKQS